MKKLIALCLCSTTLVLTAWTLSAHAADPMPNDPTYSQPRQEPGAVDSQGVNTLNQETTKTQTTTEDTSKNQSMNEDHWKNAKSCTDENGKIFKRGTKSFRSCVESMRKKEQMGGQVGEKTPESNPSDSSKTY